MCCAFLVQNFEVGASLEQVCGGGGAVAACRARRRVSTLPDRRVTLEG